MMAIQSCFCLWPFWMLNYREAWGCISCAISSSFFCAESALLFWSEAEDQPSISLRTISPRSRYPIYCLFLPITKTAKTAPKEQKSSFYFICVCVVPGTHILMYLCLWKGFTPCFFFSCTFRTYLRPLLLFVLEADRLPPDTWAMISPWDCHSGAFSVYVYMCTCVSLSPSIWMRTRRVYDVLFDLFVVLGLFALFSFHAGWIWAFRVIEKAFQMQLRKFHCVFPFDNNNNGSIRICARGSFQSTVEPEAPEARSCPSAEIRMFFFQEAL